MKTRKPSGTLEALRAIRENVNDELAGKSLAEQQRYIRECLRNAGVHVPHPRSGRRTA